MSCENHCCGFLALTGMFGLGGLTASHGLGSCPFDPIEIEEEDLFKTGTGRRTQVAATTRDAPKVAIRYPGRRSTGCKKRRG